MKTNTDIKFPRELIVAFTVYTIIIVVLVVAVSCTGCTTTRLTVGDAQIDSTYFLQKKDIKLIEYQDEEGRIFRVTAFGSDASQIVSEAIKAGLGAR